MERRYRRLACASRRYLTERLAVESRDQPHRAAEPQEPHHAHHPRDEEAFRRVAEALLVRNGDEVPEVSESHW